MHSDYCLRGEDVVAYTDERQMRAGNSPEVDRVRVRFRVLRATEGGMEGRAGEDEGHWAKGGGEAVELLQ